MMLMVVVVMVIRRTKRNRKKRRRIPIDTRMKAFIEFSIKHTIKFILLNLHTTCLIDNFHSQVLIWPLSVLRTDGLQSLK